MNKHSALNKLADFYETQAQSSVAPNVNTTQAVYPSPLNSDLSTQPADKAPAAQNVNMAAALGTQKAPAVYQTVGTATQGTYSTVNHVSGKGRNLDTQSKKNPPINFIGTNQVTKIPKDWTKWISGFKWDQPFKGPGVSNT